MELFMTNEYDLIYLCPKERSQLRSRADVDLRSCLYNLYPIFSSPMRGISGSKLVIEMAENNCLGILHRFDTLENRYAMINEVSKANVPFGIAIGLGKTEDEFLKTELSLAKTAVEKGAIMILTDCANGYIPQHSERGKILRNEFPDLALMSGSVVTQEGAYYLQNCGFNYVRVGIGGGSVCLTRNVTGIGRNQLAALKDCSSIDVHLVSDGGINESGKAVKSFALGAEFCILGGLLAQSVEAEHDGIIFGMASHRNHMLNGKEIKSIEGRDMMVEKKKPLKDILEEFLWGIRSACTYLNAKHYMEIQNKANIVGVDQW
jgi:GMP reductase